jgi:hypothetical protein
MKEETPDQLKSLKDNLPQGVRVNEKYVVEYHMILDRAERTLRTSFADYRVPPSELNPFARSGNALLETVNYTAEKFCERNFLMFKIDGALAVLQERTSVQKSKVGFR